MRRQSKKARFLELVKSGRKNAVNDMRQTSGYEGSHMRESKNSVYSCKELMMLV